MTKSDYTDNSVQFISQHDLSILFFLFLCFDITDISFKDKNIWVPIFLVQLAFHSHRFCTCRFNQLWVENIQEKKFQKVLKSKI